MKKILTLLFAFGLLMSLVQAIPMPAPVVFYFTYNGQPIENFQVTFIVGSTSITRMTNENGGIHIDVDPEGGDFKNNGDTLIVDCGFAVCDKSYSVDMLRQKPYSETFALAERPPTTCPPCDCSGGANTCYANPRRGNATTGKPAYRRTHQHMHSNCASVLGNTHRYCHGPFGISGYGLCVRYGSRAYHSGHQPIYHNI